MSDVIQKLITTNNRNEGAIVAGVDSFGSTYRVIPPISPSGIGEYGPDVTVVESNLTDRMMATNTSGVYASVFAGIYHNHSGIYWDELHIPANSLRLGSTITDYTSYYGSLSAPAFASGGASDEAFFMVQLPHTYKEGTHVYPHLHWSPGSSGTGYDSQSVAWTVDLSWVNMTGIFPFPISYSGIDSWTTLNNYEHRKVDCSCSGTTYLDGTNKTMASMIMGRVCRQITRDDDTYSAPAYLLEVDFHYQKDWLGSSTASVK
jgi:hypothetical protein